MLGDYIDIKKENIPCLYELSWDEKTAAIILRVHQNLAKKIIPPISHTVLDLAKHFGFSDFWGNFSQDPFFGFSPGALKSLRKSDEFVVFRADIPPIERIAKEICPLCSGDGKGFFEHCQKCGGKGVLPVLCEHCQGTGQNEDGKCLYCNGGKVAYYNDWQAARALAASFALFFEFASAYMLRSESDQAKQLQLLEISLCVSKENYGIGGNYGIPMAEWLCGCGQREFPAIKQAMMTAWQKMWGKLCGLDVHRFRSEIAYGAGRITLSCPGDRCDLYVPCGESPSPGRGCVFCDHNVDTCAQQLDLLCGLAALCDEKRQQNA